MSRIQSVRYKKKVEAGRGNEAIKYESKSYLLYSILRGIKVFGNTIPLIGQR